MEPEEEEMRMKRGDDEMRQREVLPPALRSASVPSRGDAGCRIGPVSRNNGTWPSTDQHAQIVISCHHTRRSAANRLPLTAESRSRRYVTACWRRHGEAALVCSPSSHGQLDFLLAVWHDGFCHMIKLQFCLFLLTCLISCSSGTSHDRLMRSCEWQDCRGAFHESAEIQRCVCVKDVKTGRT